MIRLSPRLTAASAGSLRRRLVLTTGAASALVAIALVSVVGLMVERASTSAVTQVLDERASAVISATREASGQGSIQVPDQRLDPGVVVYDAARAPVAGTVPPSLSEAFTRYSDSESEGTREVDEEWAVTSRPFTTEGGRAGVVVVAEPLRPYEDDEHDALAVSIAAGLVMVALAIALAAWITRRALQPVHQMAITAEEWSEHDLTRRFDLGPPTDEIRALGHTLDDLLEKVARAIRTEQRLTAELAHELRTPLTAARATADLMALREDLDPEIATDVHDIVAACRTMSDTITVLLELARQGATRGSCTGADLTAALCASVGDDWSRVEVRVPATLTLAVPTTVAVRALSPLLDNALRHAEHVTLDSRVDDGSAHTAMVLVGDDGPGIDPTVAARLFTPGASTTGSGLGLSLARRVARSVGGDVTVEESHQGACLGVRLPLAR
ncbi:sensor histidine kinase [Nocardioides acrostichi]|uniref:histidine kinase n=1 Tax=Nocardioides acrostichi TaxID=2784339 RepID=A0A930YBS3_9ACTN|nr:HAMP domain-containing sensor histidine kinase [Nocardioides acrostichi]MBF4162773.1 HAMP domain-containing histidine kinase [Nocardioides acrostichi]